MQVKARPRASQAARSSSQELAGTLASVTQWRLAGGIAAY